MISFYSETEDFELDNQAFYSDWIQYCIEKEGFELGSVNLIFCPDEYLLKINQTHLNHDYYTDIITFDYSSGKILEGDIFLSIDRIADNSYDFSQRFDEELSRVMIHGLLHMMGYSDSTDEQKQQMRLKENECISLQQHDSE